MDLNSLRDKAYKCACDHGFHEVEYSEAHWLMLVIGEVAEMVEADRKGEFPDVYAFKESDTVNDEDFKDKFERFIKNTVWDECADIVIRLLDISGLSEIDLSNVKLLEGEDLNIKPLTTSEFGFVISHGLVASMWKLHKIPNIIGVVYEYAVKHCVNLDWFIEQKMRYNELRPYRNGKKY